MKYLVLAALCVLVGMWLLRTPRSGRRPNAAEPESEAMERCLHCGVHFPRSESIVSAAGAFCSEDHRRQHGSR